MDEDEKLQQMIATLEDEHRALDAMIAGEKSLNPLDVQRLKKRKLWLKDEIARLNAFLHPDLSA